jgi:hypothetical protein
MWNWASGGYSRLPPKTFRYDIEKILRGEGNWEIAHPLLGVRVISETRAK